MELLAPSLPLLPDTGVVGACDPNASAGSPGGSNTSRPRRPASSGAIRGSPEVWLPEMKLCSPPLSGYPLRLSTVG